MSSGWLPRGTWDRFARDAQERYARDPEVIVGVAVAEPDHEGQAEAMIECTTEFSLDELPGPLSQALVAWCTEFHRWCLEQPERQP